MINVNNGQGQRSKRYSNNCIDGKSSSPSISPTKHNKNINPSSNKNDTNLIETFTSTKNKAANVLDSLTKKIHFLEFMKRHNINSVEYYLNNYYIKRNKNIFKNNFL